jgi:Cu/Ag efflux pump CusA
VESIVTNTHLPPGYKLEQPEWRWGSVEGEKELWKVIGLSLLGGIVVNNAIIMVDYINQLRRSGMERREAIVIGATDRLRAIFMTSLTTIA